MKVQRMAGKWYITGDPDMEPPGYGPYDTKDEAESDRRGLERYYTIGLGADNSAHRAD
jgi:hypothetical protein